MFALAPSTIGSLGMQFHTGRLAAEFSFLRARFKDGWTIAAFIWKKPTRQREIIAIR
jgi:hypothetical protein